MSSKLSKTVYTFSAIALMCGVVSSTVETANASAN